MHGEDFLRLIVREAGQPLGAVVMYRETPFTPAEARQLGGLETFIAHALTRRSDQDASLVDSGENGLIIADAKGRIVYSSAEARRLLFLATHPYLSPGRANGHETELPSAVIRICRNLAAIYAGDATAAAPVHQHRNPWAASRSAPTGSMRRICRHPP
jgi:hypothetical protein